MSNVCVSVRGTESTASLNAPLEYQFKASLMGKNYYFLKEKILTGLPVEMVVIALVSLIPQSAIPTCIFLR